MAEMMSQSKEWELYLANYMQVILVLNQDLTTNIYIWRR